MINKFLKIFALTPLAILFSCKNESLPKPQSYLSLEYPEPSYELYDTGCNYNFEFNSNIADVIPQKECGFKIQYNKMKATIFLNYKPVNGNISSLLTDAQSITYKHVVKAENIIEQPYVNNDKRVYGMFYSVSGDAASSTQFYLTDSVKNFVLGSVYFYAKPNYDSILPASSYISNDVQKLIESLNWK